MREVVTIYRLGSESDSTAMLIIGVIVFKRLLSSLPLPVPHSELRDLSRMEVINKVHHIDNIYSYA